MIRKYILLVVILLTTNLSFATIEKGGMISTDETWSEDTIKITANIYIPNGVTIDINPGVYVEFQGHYSISVDGTILAQGSVSDSIKAKRWAL